MITRAITNVWDEMISDYIRTLAASIDIQALKIALAGKWLSDAGVTHITIAGCTFTATSTTCPCGIARKDCEYHR